MYAAAYKERAVVRYVIRPGNIHKNGTDTGKRHFRKERGIYAAVLLPRFAGVYTRIHTRIDKARRAERIVHRFVFHRGKVRADEFVVEGRSECAICKRFERFFKIRRSRSQSTADGIDRTGNFCSRKHIAAAPRRIGRSPRTGKKACIQRKKSRRFGSLSARARTYRVFDSYRSRRKIFEDKDAHTVFKRIFGKVRRRKSVGACSGKNAECKEQNKNGRADRLSEHHKVIVSYRICFQQHSLRRVRSHKFFQHRNEAAFFNQVDGAAFGKFMRTFGKGARRYAKALVAFYVAEL